VLIISTVLVKVMRNVRELIVMGLSLREGVYVVIIHLGKATAKDLLGMSLDITICII